MDGRLPLPTLLSHALVAFTIEFDNESEHQLPHRTTNHRSTADSLHGPWLVSLVMWLNCMRFVDDKGVTVQELEQLARTRTNLNGMERWGYVFIEPNPTDRRPKPPRSTWLIRPTRAGQKAQELAAAVCRSRKSLASAVREERDRPTPEIAVGNHRPAGYGST